MAVWPYPIGCMKWPLSVDIPLRSMQKRESVFFSVYAADIAARSFNNV